MDLWKSLHSSYFVLFLTFLSVSTLVRTSQGQGQRADSLQFVTEPDARYYVAKKHPANITCEAYGVVSIIFVCMGSQIPDSSVKTLKRFDDEKGLELTRVTIQVRHTDLPSQRESDDDDVGVEEEEFGCHCSADDGQGQSTISRHAIVSSAYLRKEFQRVPLSQTVSLGSVTTFNCIPPIGQPTPEIIWRKDGKRINPEKDGHFIIQEDGTLLIRAVKTEDAGKYECVARNEANRRESPSAVLNIVDDTIEDGYDGEENEKVYVPTTVASADTAKPRRMRDTVVNAFTKEPSGKNYLTRTDPVTLECEVKGAAQMTVECNKKRVSEDKQNKTFDNVNKVISIAVKITYEEIENFVNTHSGDEYKCQCVAWFLDGIKWSSENSKFGTYMLAYLKDDFKQVPSNTLVQVGWQAQLRCQPPEGKPDPWVYWIFEQTRIDPRSSPRYAVDSDGSLIIDRVTLEDSGRYYCVAQNSAGYRQSSIGVLTVTEESVVTTQTSQAPITTQFPLVVPASPVYLIDLNSSYYVSQDTHATLVCEAFPADMIALTCNGQFISNDTKSVAERHPSSAKTKVTTTGIVTLDKLQASQRPTYTCSCIAYLSNGTQWVASVHSKTATIKESYLELDFVYGPRGDSYPIGETAEFACQPPKGEPTPEMTWMKNGEEIVPGADSNIDVSQDLLVIENVQEDDAGEYACVASNMAGTRKSRTAVLEIMTATTTTTRATTTTTRATTSTRARAITTIRATPTTSTISSSVTTTTDGTEVSSGRGDESPMLDGALFVTSPPPEEFIIMDEPLILKWSAVGVKRLLLFCNQQEMTNSSEYKTVFPELGEVLELEAIFTRANFSAAGVSEFNCDCRAYYQDLDSKWTHSSSYTSVKIAYLDRTFAQEPVRQVATLGVNTQLICRPPRGVPPPKVSWVKNGMVLDTQQDDNLDVTEEGSLIIKSVRSKDAGNYSCQATNVAGSYSSTTVELSIREEPAVDTTVPVMVSEPDGEPEEGGELEPEEGGEPEPEPEREPTEETAVTRKPDDMLIEVTEAEIVTAVAGGVESRPVITQPYLRMQSPELIYILKSQPATVVCEAVGVELIVFTCSDGKIQQSSVDYSTNEMTKSLTALIQVPRNVVENHHKMTGSHDYTCHCQARSNMSMSDDQSLTSHEVNIQVAYMKKQFTEEPRNITAVEGGLISLYCEPPESNPRAEVYWLFNKERVQGTAQPPGTLVIADVSQQHAGAYECVAENIAQTRHSSPAYVSVIVGRENVSDIDEVTESPIKAEESAGGDRGEVDCIDRISQCSVYMPQTSQKIPCRTVENYIKCLDNSIDKCRDQEPASVEQMINLKSVAQKICNISATPVKSAARDMCQELMECQTVYASETNRLGTDSETGSTLLVFCQGIKQFLTCAHNAAEKCKISVEGTTSLEQIAKWFEDHCSLAQRWKEECLEVPKCQPPIIQLTQGVTNFVQPSSWCSYINSSLVPCSQTAVESCDSEESKEDMQKLAKAAEMICPNVGSEATAEDMDVKEEEEKLPSAGPSSDSHGTLWRPSVFIYGASLIPIIFVGLTGR